MKNIRYVIFLFICMFISIFYVKASCTDEEIKELKELAKDIKITYKYVDEAVIDEETYYNLFEVKIKNISDDFYVLYGLNNNRIDIKEGTGSDYFTNGTWTFKIYSSECEKQVDEINVFIPRFNIYSTDPLCEGIDGNDFALCGKYYEYDVSYESFKERVTHYRNTHNIDSKNEEEDINQLEDFLNKVLTFVIKYKWYFAGGFVVCLCIIIFILIINKRRKRGILE